MSLFLCTIIDGFPISELIHLLPNFSATDAVVPLPPKKSATIEFSFEEAFIIKTAIAIIKDKKDKEFFIERNLEIPSNATSRRDNIIRILKIENDSN